MPAQVRRVTTIPLNKIFAVIAYNCILVVVNSRKKNFQTKPPLNDILIVYIF